MTTIMERNFKNFFQAIRKFRMYGGASLIISFIFVLGSVRGELIDWTVELQNVQQVGEGEEVGIVPLNNGSKLPLASEFPTGEGTFAFWLKPENWDKEEEGFVNIATADADQLRWRIYKYKNDKNRYGITFLYGKSSGGGEVREYAFITFPIDDWIRGQWQHVAVTWSKNDGLIQLYTNGQLRDSRKIGSEIFPTGTTGEILLMAPDSKPGEEFFETEFRGIKLVSQVMSAEEIQTLADVRMESEKVEITDVPTGVMILPKVKVKPEIDGAISPGEWDQATKIYGGLGVGRPEVVVGQIFQVYANYDDEAINLLMVSPAEGMRLKADVQGDNEGKISLDDSMEIFFAPSGDKANYYQMITNSAGYMYSNHSGNKEWAPEVELKNSVHEGFWYVEIRIPFAAFGEKTPKVGSRWLGNICRNWAMPDSTRQTSWSFAGKTFFERMAEIVFGSEEEFVRFELDLETLKDGRISGSLSEHGAEKSESKLLLLNGHGEEIAKTITDEKAETEEISFEHVLPINQATEIRTEVTAENNILYRSSLPILYSAGHRLRVMPDLDKKEILVSLTPGRSVDSNAVLEVEFLLDETNMQKGSFKQKIAGGKKHELVIAEKDLVPGYYKVVGKILDDQGTVVADAEIYYDHIGSPEWIDKEYVLKSVPWPWTPLEFKDSGVVAMWGREYTTSASLLPESIQTQGEALTSAPIEVLLNINGTSLDWGKDKINWQEKSELEGVAHIKYEVDGVVVNAKAQVEFDGLWFVELEIDPRGKKSVIDQLEVVIPLTKDVAHLVYAHNHDRNIVQEALTEKSLKDYLSHVWIGNDAYGLTWFTESNQFWKAPENGQVIEFSRKEKSDELKIHLVAGGLEIEQPVRYLFGIQATPVRSRDARRHNVLRLNPTVGSQLGHAWSIDKTIKKYYGKDREWGFLSPHVLSAAKLKEELKKWRDKGVTMPLYLAPDIVSPLSTEYQIFREEWRNAHATYPFACAQSSFTNFTHAHMQELIRDAELRGIYVDCAKAYPCGNKNHGCGYTDENGALILTTPVLALRHYLKGLYAMLHEVPELDGLTSGLVLHLSAGLTTVAHAFSDVVLEGEEVQYKITQTPSYFDLYSLEQWRAIFGAQYGINVALLPNYGRVGDKADMDSKPLNATFLSQVLLTDASVWNIWSNRSYVNEMLSILDQFHENAEGEVAFLPYWNQKLVASKNQGILISLYQHKNGVLGVLVNPTKEEIRSELIVNDPEVQKFLSTAKLLDPATLQRSALENAGFTLPAENFLLLEMGINK